MLPTLSVADAVRRAQLLAVCFLLYLLSLPIALEFVAITPGAVDRTVFVAICFVCVAEIGVAFLLRGRYPLSDEAATLEPSDAGRASKWLRIQIASYVIAVSVGLYGVVLRFVGASFKQSALFYAVALVLLISWWPRKP